MSRLLDPSVPPAFDRRKHTHRVPIVKARVQAIELINVRPVQEDIHIRMDVAIGENIQVGILVDERLEDRTDVGALRVPAMQRFLPNRLPESGKERHLDVHDIGSAPAAKRNVLGVRMVQIAA